LAATDDRRGGGVVIWWSVTIEAESDESDGGGVVGSDKLDDLLSVLDHFSPVVIVPPEEPRGTPIRYGVDLSVLADAAAEATDIAVAAFETAVKEIGLPEWPIVKLGVITEAELDASLATSNFPTLLGVSELADLLGVSKQRASELARTASFPSPVATLASGPVWVEHAVVRYLEEWERRPGRPKAAAG
jgi:hypothetical protein